MTLIAGCWWNNIYRTIWNIRSKQLVCSFSLCSCEKCVRGDHLALHGNVSLSLHFRFFASIFRSLLTFRIFTNIYKRSSQPFLYLVFLNEWKRFKWSLEKGLCTSFSSLALMIKENYRKVITNVRLLVIMQTIGYNDCRSIMMMMMAVVIEDTRIGNGIIVTSNDGNRQTYLVSIN